MKTYRFACVGVGGYAANYFRALSSHFHSGRIRVVAAADPRPPENADALLEGVRLTSSSLFADYREMFTAHPEIDAVVVGTPISFHEQITVEAVERGFDVLCAKPATTTVQSIDTMIGAAERTGKTVLVDFQHVYSDATQRIKQSISDGSLGRVQNVVIKTVWQRNDRYFRRNPGAGRAVLDGRYVLDGPLSNPHAHYIMNALYFSHPERFSFASPTSVQAELYRCRDIQCEDTACVRCLTDTGVEILMYSTLCGCDEEPWTEIEVVAENGTAKWQFTEFEIETKDGGVQKESVERATSSLVVETFLNVLDGDGRSLVGLSDSRNHVLFTNGAYESAREITPIDSQYLELNEGGDTGVRCIKGIKETVANCAKQRCLFSEYGVPWAQAAGVPFSMDGYSRFSVFG